MNRAGLIELLCGQARAVSMKWRLLVQVGLEWFAGCASWTTVDAAVSAWANDRCPSCVWLAGDQRKLSALHTTADRSSASRAEFGVKTDSRH